MSSTSKIFACTPVFMRLSTEKPVALEPSTPKKRLPSLPVTVRAIYVAENFILNVNCREHEFVSRKILVSNKQEGILFSRSKADDSAWVHYIKFFLSEAEKKTIRHVSVRSPSFLITTCLLPLFVRRCVDDFDFQFGQFMKCICILNWISANFPGFCRPSLPISRAEEAICVSH